MRPKLPEGFEYELFPGATYVLDAKGVIILVVLTTTERPPKIVARFGMTSQLGSKYQQFDNEENAINGMLMQWRLGISNKKE